MTPIEIKAKARALARVIKENGKDLSDRDISIIADFGQFIADEEGRHCHDCEVFRGTTLKASIHRYESAEKMLRAAMQENRKNLERFEKVESDLSEARKRLGEAKAEVYESVANKINRDLRLSVDEIGRMCSDMAKSLRLAQQEAPKP